MKRHVALTMAAFLTAGGMVWTTSSTLFGADDPANPANAPAVQPGNNVGRFLEMPAGIQTIDLKNEKAIKKELGAVVNDAVDHNHFDNLIGDLVKPEKDRLSDAKKMDTTKLNEVIGEIRRNWKQKYGDDFDIGRGDVENVFNNQFAILEGEVTDPTLAMNNWPVAATPEIGAKPAAEQGRVTDTSPNDAKLDKGRNVALVRIPDMMGVPALKVSLIHEHLVGWKLDIPNNISGQQLHDNLLKHLSYVNDHKDKWPADVNEAYRDVAHHVFMALYDVNMPMHERL
jgi:hypothetical protein